MILPEIFFAQMKKIFCAEEYEKFFLSFDDPPVRGLRINTLKIKNTHEIVEKICEKNFEKICEKNFVPWCNTGFIFSDERPAKSIAYHAGLFYIQEPSAMSPAEILGANPGHRVLDLCAAPGGKSVQIAGHLNGECVLVSNDASPSRCRALVKNLERAGITNAVVLAEQPKKLAERFREFFDRILVDAPCSGEGMFRRDADAVKAYMSNKPDACATLQKEILRYAAQMLRPGGRMVYSTCTFNTIENEEVVAAFLQTHEEFFLVQIEHAAFGLREGIGLSQTARIFPHEKGEGHFIALFERRRAVPAPIFEEISPSHTQRHDREKNPSKNFSQHPERAVPAPIFEEMSLSHAQRHDREKNLSKNFSHHHERAVPAPDFEEMSPSHAQRHDREKNPSKNFSQHHEDKKNFSIFKNFCDEFLDFSFPCGEFFSHEKSLFFRRVPLDLRGLRVARSGWLLGECAENRFVPSHALAMGLRKEHAKFSVELSEADAQKFLRGESLPHANETANFEDFSHPPDQRENAVSRETNKPWVLVCFEGFPLGWARLVQGRLKNNLPVGWAVR